MDRDGIAAVILAGGRSSRMGIDKALLDWHGTRLIDHAAHLLKETGIAAIYASGAAQNTSDMPGLFHGYPWISDATPHQGPVGGICAGIGLLASHKQAVLFMAVDMPFLEKQALHDVLDCPADIDAQFFAGHPLPCCLQLSPAMVNHAQDVALLMQGGRGYSIKAFLAALSVRQLPVHPALERQFANLNTPAEWQQALQSPFPS